MENTATAPDISVPAPGKDMLLKAGEVAQVLRVPNHLQELPAIRLGRYVRFRRSDIERFLEERSGACQ